MKITSVTKFYPFSHRPGTSCLIPGTAFKVQVYPTRIRIYSLEDPYFLKEISLSAKGPIQDFTVMQDLEKGCITVFGKNLPRFHLLPSLEISTKKNPPCHLNVTERLSLGSHKKQEWDGIRKRANLCEIFPLWMRLGQVTPIHGKHSHSKGPYYLLDQCQSYVKSHQVDKIAKAFNLLFLAGFKDLLVPRQEDDEYQGILHDKTDENSLYLLKEGAELIRSLFIQESQEDIALLPHLPPEFFSGRMVGVKTAYGSLSFEWTKKTLRNLLFSSTCTGTVRFLFPSYLKSYRLRNHPKDKGKKLPTTEILEINSGTLYLLDQFQK